MLFFKSSFCYPNDIKTSVNFICQRVELIKVIWERRYVHMKKMVPLWLFELNVFLKSSILKYWEEFSKSYSLTASLSLSIRTFSRELLFLVKALNLIVSPWIVEWRSLSFIAEKGNNFFEQVKQYHTVLSLINKLYVCTLILLHLMLIHWSQLSHFKALWFLATEFREIPQGNAVGICLTLLKLRNWSRMSSCVIWEKKEVFGKELWKELSGTYTTFQKVLGILLLTCTEG